LQRRLYQFDGPDGDAKKAMLIPTPGQTEQEYLSEHLQEAGIFYSVPQDQLDLIRDLEVAEKLQPIFSDYPFLQLTDSKPCWLKFKRVALRPNE